MKWFWRWLRRLTKYSFIAGLLLLLLFSGLLWYTTTDSFQQMVRGRLIRELEYATGGRVEVGSFHVVPLRFEVEVRDLTIHGRESADQLPYAHIDSVLATVNLSSALGAQLSFHSLTLNRPVIHIIFYPDGRSNQPTPKQKSGVLDFEHLFSVSIDRLDVRNGELLYRDQRLPLDFNSNDISASLNYSFLRRRYSGNLAIGKAETLFDGYRPVAWAGKAIFAIDRNGVDVKSLEATAERSKFQAVGTVTNFEAPLFKGTYDLELDLAQAGSVSRQPHLKAGALALTGVGSWSQQNFSSSGKFSLRDLTWQDSNILAKSASASGQFSLDPQTISVSQVEGQFLRGSFMADAEVTNWQTQQKRIKQKAEQQGAIKIRARDFSLAELLSSLGPQFDPVNKLKFAGNVSATTELRWHGSVRNAEATVAADVSRPSRLQPGQIPVTGSTHVIYDMTSNEWNFSELTANTPASQVRAAGALSPASSLRISFATADFREWEPVMRHMFPSGMPFVVHGRAVFNGTATGKPADMIIAGNLQLQDFDMSLPTGSSQQIHWDSLTAAVQASGHNLSLRNGVLQHNDAIVRVDGATELADWKPLPSSPFRFRIDIQNVNATELATLLGYDHAISGRLAANLELSGTALQPRGQGSVNLLGGSVRGYAIDSASAAVTINDNQFVFKNVVAARGNSRIAGNGTYDRSSQNIQLAFTGSNFDLTEVPQLQHSRIAVTGAIDFSARLSGSVVMPDVNADLRLRNLAFNGELAGDYVLNAVSHGPDLRVTGHSEFKNAELLLDGNIRMQELWPSLIDLHFTHLDVDSFLQTYLHGHVTGHSAVAGTLRLEGPLLDPKRLTVAGDLTDVYADVEKVKIRNDGPIRFNVTNRALKVDEFHIVGDNTDFAGNGSMQFAGDRALDFRANGKVGLQLLHAYDPDFTSSGTLTAEGQVTGTLDAPVIQGKLQLQDAAISDINLPSALSEINGTLLFSQNRITIQNLAAKTGGGTLTLAGHADVAGRLINFDLTASADDVRLRYPPGVSSTATGALRWTGSSAGSVLSGDITITKLGFTPGFDFGTYLERTAQVSSLPQTDPVLNKIRLDLHVVTAPDLQARTSVMRLQGEADLHIRGNAAKPVLLGRADVFEGEAYFQGTRYRLERGGVIFGTPSASNPTATVPFLDLEATTHVRDYEITLSLTGPANRPKMNYRSDPPLPPADIISLLAFGGTSEQSAQLQQSSQSVFSQQASNAMLAAALNATLNNRTQRLFGTNSRIKIDPQGLATETSPTQTGPAVTIEQQVKDNLTLTYTTEVSQTSQQVIRAEYNVTRNISIVAIRDQNGVVSFDVKIRRRKR